MNDELKFFIETKMRYSSDSIIRILREYAALNNYPLIDLCREVAETDLYDTEAVITMLNRLIDFYGEE